MYKSINMLFSDQLLMHLLNYVILNQYCIRYSYPVLKTWISKNHKFHAIVPDILYDPTSSCLNKCSLKQCSEYATRYYWAFQCNYAIIFKLLNINWLFVYWLVNATARLKFLIKYIDDMFLSGTNNCLTKN